MFYVTTPIYYVNAQPHIGHAYTTILADVLRRYHRLFGEETWFVTGVDEHGQKVQEAAAKRGLTPQEHVDDMERHFRELWPTLEIDHDDFIRTTEARHRRVVQHALQTLYDQGLIYADQYEGWYSPAVERYWTEKDLVDGKCPESGQPVQYIQEKNYFFRMSRFQEPLLAHIEANPDFIQPETRRNEVLGFLRKPLKDLCISRPKARLSWGIPFPFDPDFVTYVWFDALLNYVTAAGYRSDEARFRRLWAGAVHLIGKDILTTHAVYWPTMLLALGLPLPKRIVATGWWLVDDTKMSKSLGNVVHPLDLKDKYGVDVLRYFLMREMAIGQDANFSEAALVARNNSDLANDLGNLTNRTVRMVQRYFDGWVPALVPAQDPELAALDQAVRDAVEPLKAQVEAQIRAVRPNQAIETVLTYVRSLNKYIDQTKPFKTAKDDPTRTGTVLRTVLEGVRVAANLLHPVLPVKAEEILRVIGAGAPVARLQDLAFGGIPEGAVVRVGDPVFPRRIFARDEDETTQRPPKPGPEATKAAKTKQAKQTKQDKQDKQAKPTEQTQAAGAGEELVDFALFERLDLRVALVEAAEAVPKADKLLKLTLRLGPDDGDLRTVVAGLRPHYEAQDLVGRRVVVLANLKPRKLRGVLSQGMVLVADAPEGLALLRPEADVPPGTPVA